ncbi:NAD-dependent epimerase/dehydratase family protein [Vandammella animalimorsus]|uniref:NAD-dependent epimerase/dehydratase family protein n=1 Tax=Vandammella animalimorsus TaxID=2029117 RepID=UPI001EEF0EEF|nr:NAD-dependent epimerase/dehydratase family protein [Vandammella animalimorsus]
MAGGGAAQPWSNLAARPGRPVGRGRSGALPARFRQERVLVIGCGDVGMRLARLQGRNGRWLALTSSPGRCGQLRQLGLQPLLGNLDEPATLRRLAGLATRLVYLAPPPAAGALGDPRSLALCRSLRRGRRLPRSVVYVSTTGVYGDCQGQWVAESRPTAPASAQARRRVAAEAQLRGLLHSHQRLHQSQGQRVRVALLRAPGIYAIDRAHGDPRQRLQEGEPVLQEREDVYINRIHAEDLARACWLALWRARPGRAFNACDDTALKLGEYWDEAARRLGLPPPPRITRAEAERIFSDSKMRFLRESRRLRNQRIKAELRLQWRYPTVWDGLAPLWAAAGGG